MSCNPLITTHALYWLTYMAWLPALTIPQHMQNPSLVAIRPEASGSIIPAVQPKDTISTALQLVAPQ